MNIKEMGKILDKYYTPEIRKNVAKMKKDAERLIKQLEKDPDNIEIAIKLAMNPFNTVKEEHFGQKS